MAVIVLGRSHRDRDLLFWRLGLGKTNLPLLRRSGQTFCTIQTALDWPDEQTEIDDEISDQLKEDADSGHDVAIMPQIPSSFGQNRGILFFAEDRRETPPDFARYRSPTQLNPFPIGTKVRGERGTGRRRALPPLIGER